MHRLLSLVLLVGLCAALAAQDKPYTPKVAPASEDYLQAQKRIRVPAGTRVDLFAAEPLLANPVAFAIDEKNRFYVSETFRLHKGVSDIRGLSAWLDDDLACRTVADRIAMMKKHLGAKASTWAVEHERIRLLEDTTGSGKADKSTVFADGFNHLEDGIAAGLLARQGKVWYACIPNLWLLQDTKNAGKADSRKVLSTGYGVRIAFIGHDLHGPVIGPDGRLYFSCGDRGLHVEHAGGVIRNPDSGAVLRCDQDGSNLELFATGLRNPQALAFDKFGNLFTGDNNADGGDRARWVYLVEGGDSGWRIGYQQMNVPMVLGPWNSERLWDPKSAPQAGYIVPPIANLADGPSGLAYNPGVTALPEKYRDHFFLCDFRGGSGNSGVRSFAVKPKGASFELVDSAETVWSVLPTDVQFAPDGALYLSDWVDGWGLTGKGRLWKWHDEALSKSAPVLEVKKLLAEGMKQRNSAELLKLLDHGDLRVRLEAQFALETQPDAAKLLARVARDGKDQLARLHAIWGVGNLGRKDAVALKALLPLLADKDAEVRAQAAKTLGEGKGAELATALLPLLKDAEPRVRFFAAQSIGKLGDAAAVPALLQYLRDNNDQDPVLRHAGAVALARLNDSKALLAAASDESPAVRQGALLAFRRLENPEIARFLNDADPRLVLEAARAINDVPINAAMPQLAAIIDRSGLADPVRYRALNANFRLGQPANAQAIARLAARADVSEPVRIEALRQLGSWEKPSGRDRVVGVWRPLEPRDAKPAAEALKPALGGIFSGPDKLRQEAAKLAGRYGIKDIGPTLLAMIADKGNSGAARAEMLGALQALKDERLTEGMKLALADADPRLRAAGRSVQARLTPDEALPNLTAALDKGETIERQQALATLAEMKNAAADKVLADCLDQLLSGKTTPEVQLDLLEAAAKRPTGEIKEKLARFEAARSKTDHLAKFREALSGGDAEAGRRVFLHKTEVSCLRCHKVMGNGGDVGPELTGLGAKQPREYLLEAIVDPNRQIAKGFETVVLGLKNGQVVTGIVKAEDGKEVRLMTAEGKLLVVAKPDIEERQAGKSPMPEDIMKQLSKRELRDLVEFLATLK